MSDAWKWMPREMTEEMLRRASTRPLPRNATPLDQIRTEYAAAFAAAPTPDDAVIEQVAQAMCSGDGYSPDRMVASTFAVTTGSRDAGGTTSKPDAVHMPIWKGYVHLARAAINAMSGDNQ